MEGMQGNAMDPPDYDSIWRLAADSGPFAVRPRIWYNFCQNWFTKNRKKEKLGQFGPDRENATENFRVHGTKDGWNKLLSYLAF